MNMPMRLGCTASHPADRENASTGSDRQRMNCLGEPEDDLREEDQQNSGDDPACCAISRNPL